MPTLRDRILDAGVELICTVGWDRTTMGQLAERVGVSRQMVYKEIGARDKLARAIVIRHAEVFLSGVVERLREHGPEPLTGIPAAVEYVLRATADDPLLKAVLAAGHGGTQDLLPLLTIHPEPVLGRALATLQAESAALYGGLGLADLPTLVEVVVRLTLSHLLQPSGPVEGAVGQAEWLVRAALSGPRDVA